IARRCLRQGRDICRMGEVDIFRIHAEKILARLLHAVYSAAVRGFVEIGVQYLVFRVDLLEPEREDDLFELTHDRLLLCQERVLYHLLGDGRAALAETAGRDVHHDRAHERERPEAVVLVERGVLYRYRRVAEIGADLIEGHGGAPHGAVHVVEDDVARAVVDLGGFGDLTVLEIIDGGNRGKRRPEDCRADDDEPERDYAERTELHPRGQFPPPSSYFSEHTSGHCIGSRRLKKARASQTPQILRHGVKFGVVSANAGKMRHPDRDSIVFVVMLDSFVYVDEHAQY